MRGSELMEAWEGRIGDYRASGLTMIQWSERTGFSVGRIKYWITKLNKRTQNTRCSGWAKVDVLDSHPSAEGRISVRIGVTRIEVGPGFDPSVLSEVVRVVASTC